MRYCVVFMVIGALATTACTETGDETADAIVPRDTMAMVDEDTARSDPSVSPAAPSPSDGAPADASAPSDAPADDVPTDEPGSDTGDDAAASIPSRFHGEWNAELTACGTGSSETRLRISADQLRFYESAGSVIDVDVQNDRVITVTARYQGEGDTWEDERRLSLSADGNSLTVSNGTALVRYRCP